MHTFGHDEVVDTPSGVLLACTESVRPPRVGGVVGMQRTERIDESVGKELCHLLAFLVGESGVLAVGLGILQVYFLVCYVQVTAQNDWLLPPTSCGSQVGAARPASWVYSM